MVGIRVCFLVDLTLSVFSLMVALDEMWVCFSLTEEEQGGDDVPRQEDKSVHHLAGKFLTKQVLNVDAVARTLKPL